MKNNYRWAEICNTWLNGDGVTNEEIAYLATMNMADFCYDFKAIVTRVVYDFCEQYAEEWSDYENPSSWGYKLNNGTILKMQYGGVCGNYWNNEGHYSIAE